MPPFHVDGHSVHDYQFSKTMNVLSTSSSEPFPNKRYNPIFFFVRFILSSQLLRTQLLVY